MQRLDSISKVIEDPQVFMDRALDKNSQVSQITSKEMYEDARKYADREMTETDYFVMKEKYEEKVFLNLFFEGSKHLMELTEKAFNDVRFETEMIKKGIFISILGTTFISYSHSFNDVEKTLVALDETCKKITSTVKNEDYKKHLEGKLPETIWTMKIQPTKV